MEQRTVKTGYTICRADGTTERGEIEWPTAPGYDRLKALLEPLVEGPIEHVYVLHEGKRADLFVDEVGHLQNKPINEAATKIYRANTLARSPGTDPETLPDIVGTAVLFDRVVWF